MKEFEGRRRGMLTTEEWCNPVSNMFGTRGSGIVATF